MCPCSVKVHDSYWYKDRTERGLHGDRLEPLCTFMYSFMFLHSYQLYSLPEEGRRDISANIFYFNCIFNIPVLEWVKQLSQNRYFMEGECFVISFQTFLYNYLFSPWHWLNLLSSIYIHLIATGSYFLLHYNYVNEVDCTTDLSLKWTNDWCMVQSYNPSKHLTCTKCMAHINVSAFLWLTTISL